MESLTRRSLLKTASLALVAGLVRENSAASSAIGGESMTDPAKGSAGRKISVLAAPSNLGLKPPSPGKEPGARFMAEALRKHGLVSRLKAEDAGTVVAPKYEAKYEPGIDPATKVRNAAAIREYSLELAARVGTLLDEGRFPLLVGGDCSILLGSGLGLRRRGRYGLLFIDGHSDLLTPETSQSGGAAGMDLALATGLGPGLLTDIESRSPYFRPSDVVVFGYRQPEANEDTPYTPRAPMTAFPLDKVRSEGTERATAAAVARLEEIGAGYWIHLDLDVLSPDFMPAVDSPDPGGMTPTELTAVLKIAMRSRKCLGMELTIYDPELDPTGKYAELIVNMVVEAVRM